jgi:hypothetical protein
MLTGAHSREDGDPGRRRWWVSRQGDRCMARTLWLFEMTFGRRNVSSSFNRKPFRKYQFVNNDRDISPSRVLAFSLPSRLDNMKTNNHIALIFLVYKKENVYMYIRTGSGER